MKLCKNNNNYESKQVYTSALADSSGQSANSLPLQSPTPPHYVLGSSDTVSMSDRASLVVLLWLVMRHAQVFSYIYFLIFI